VYLLQLGRGLKIGLEVGYWGCAFDSDQENEGWMLEVKRWTWVAHYLALDSYFGRCFSNWHLAFGL